MSGLEDNGWYRQEDSSITKITTIEVSCQLLCASIQTDTIKSNKKKRICLLISIDTIDVFVFKPNRTLKH